MVKKETKINLNKSDTSCVVEMEPLRPEEVSLNVFVETCSCLVSHPFTRTRGLLVWKSVLSFMKKQDDFYTFHSPYSIHLFSTFAIGLREGELTPNIRLA